MSRCYDLGTLQLHECLAPSRECGMTPDTMHDAHSVLCFEHHGQDSCVRGPLAVAPTIHRKTGTGGNNVPLVLHKIYLTAGLSDTPSANIGASGFSPIS